jgi:hypothetical protein
MIPQGFVAALKRAAAERLDDGCDRHFQRGRTAQSASGGQVGGDRGVESRDREAQGLIAGDHAGRILGPAAAGWGERGSEVELGPGDDARTLTRDHGSAVGAPRDADADGAVDGHRQHEAVVVIGVFTDQIDAAGGRDLERIE